MNINKSAFNNLFLIIAFIGISNKVHSQEVDIWSGNYILKSSNSQPIDSIKIEKIMDLNKKDVVSKFESNLSRWKITSKKDNYENGTTVRQFLFDLQDNRNEYEQFGWTELYLKNEMKCLDAGHFFICQTKPNSKVKSDDNKSFFTKTGIFGIKLHFGLFELEKF